MAVKQFWTVGCDQDIDGDPKKPCEAVGEPFEVKDGKHRRDAIDGWVRDGWRPEGMYEWSCPVHSGVKVEQAVMAEPREDLPW